MAGKVETFIKRMQAIFGPPYKDATGEVIGILAKKLQSFPEDVLNAAVEHLALSREFKSWPMPVEIIAACKAQQAKLYPVISQPKPDPMAEWSDAHCRKADELIQCKLGVEAAEGGWLDALWEFCRKQQRLPEGQKELDAVFKDAERQYAKMQSAMARLEDHKGWSKGSMGLRTSLAELAEKMTQTSQRRHALVMKQRRAAA